jgi:O-acetyl-ADP-ribose deacetylase (regulator of RNase III)
MISEHKGDLFTTDAPALAHGVNCVGAMGAGIAKEFRDKYPDMYAGYRKICTANALRPGEIFMWDNGRQPAVFNIASQRQTGADARYHWLIAGMCNMAVEMCYLGLDRVAMPKIGCGIGGLVWGSVFPWVAVVAKDYNIHIEVWTL